MKKRFRQFARRLKVVHRDQTLKRRVREHITEAAYLVHKQRPHEGFEAQKTRLCRRVEWQRPIFPGVSP